ncbi:glutathione S-transferase [Sulfitobacter donghicola]|uniref:Glutathione S-transferase n=1 Tax=Sulfitobacter donghicola DSW-25 = KCTC 12864 = JCM 14565 TaxID=1300350 RepID=A0A073ILN9_9RHOB|nr:glutathione S-transferase [Sulfitobacter donghicola]KEJ90485.1 glutathione S-transferase [Sulfitobacter donghicola DSW-25 = KCTC 12864 = JCM 14565]KIN67725.1 Glutathione S-transferase-like protein [Sulfitobacter donghicola DSW-25 = KCTC 12864 = JCM 14565]
MTGSAPILYSFRRCPYAMRARLAVLSSGCRVELREVVLRDKPEAFLAVSPSATVPCLVDKALVVDESLDIMKWALDQNDPQGWLDMPEAGHDWIARADGPFKHALDRTKYATRYPDEDATKHRNDACIFLCDLDQALGPWIFDQPSLADYAILPFVRQFAFIDKAWFDAQPWPNLHAWLGAFLASEDFQAIMPKFEQWQPQSAPVFFPD